MFARCFKVPVIYLVCAGLFAKPIADLLPGFVGEVFNRGQASDSDPIAKRTMPREFP